jgi:GMP synthase (glutamine-hydrolysing)
MSKDRWVLDLLELIKKITAKGVPLLGVCFGHQLIARALGSDQNVRRSETPEFGWCEIIKTEAKTKYALLAELPQSFYSFQAHFEEVAQLPAGFVVLATNERCGIQAFAHQSLPVFGVQFHPERNVEEGQLSIAHRKKSEKMSKDWLINAQKGQLYFNEQTPKTIFNRFLEL